ncbi:response regulator [Agaricicola taiwanensis]|uniref:Response regulator n=1 Tax=Agaricicola taiwanensis TaxID=591372 RepID=A0A8J2VM70_9RHOB|nr:response regulator [Agaricicola taiwanensis]GGE37987.1 response regulator [Agaricicola taiwanensis]
MASGPFARLSILVIDNDPHMRKIARGLLTGFPVGRVYEASDGAQGLEMVHQFRPDAILTEWEMPMLNGEEMVRLIRNPKTSPFATVPIIVMTAHTQRYQIHAAIQAGVNEIIVKPFSAKDLLQRLESVVARPRPFIQIGGYFGPLPRENAARAAGAFPRLDTAAG